MDETRFTRMLEARGITLTADEHDVVWRAPIKKLLTPPTANPKVAKGLKKGYATAILHLAPAMQSGFQMCPMATIGCVAACLNTAGRGGMGLDANGMNAIQRARIRKTHWLIARKPEFLAQLVKEIAAHERKTRAANLKPAVRLNGTSDLPWERIPVTRNGRQYPNVMRAFPRVTFYDYTKRTDRHNLPRNYSLTFSLADGNEAHAETAFANGLNVAVVLRTPEIARRAGTRYARLAPLPATYNGIPVIDGDESDLRFKDPHNVFVGLRAKGRAVTDQTGFVKDAA